MRNPPAKKTAPTRKTSLADAYIYVIGLITEHPEEFNRIIIFTVVASFIGLVYMTVPWLVIAATGIHLGVHVAALTLAA